MGRRRTNTPAVISNARQKDQFGHRGKFRVAEIALGHAQKLLSQWSLPLLYCPRIATIQGAGVAFPGAGISRCSHQEMRDTW